MDLSRRALIRGAAGASLALSGALDAATRPAPRPAAAVSGPIIDLHSHWISPAVLASLGQRLSGPRVLHDDRGRTLLARPLAGQAGPAAVLGPSWLDIDVRLAHLESLGIAHQLLSWPTTLGIDPNLSPAESVALWSAYNTDLAAVVRAHPRQFSGLAALSTSDIGWSVRELQRGHQELGFIGGVLPVNGFASLDAASHFAPILEAAQRLGSHLFLHTGFAHQSVSGQPPLTLHADTAEVRGALDTAWQFASSVVTLGYTEFLDPYPDVTVQIAMLGGSGVSALLAESVTRSGIALSPRFKRLLFDTGAAGQGPAAIAAASRVFGASQVVFGSDYGPSADIGGVVRHVAEAGLAPADHARVLFGNAAALLGRHGVTVGG
ncbi:amidohydrolase family protein [Novosphingobium flavum]|uniref:Amidohydrolase family protein n=1 Tax=Novosphingobium flavum TaxID=1778672 RepID=A0A7X1FR54_9SPHN|nr:amidohydrolase family protein [Novosphingobium flavum]MBC2665455.1 amidohydrolase family protein [Novosphingobium flavum]